MTRILIGVLVAAVGASSVAAQAGTPPKAAPPSTSAQKHDMGKMADHMSAPWKQMNAFHTVLAAAYHPVEAGDLKPLMAKATDLAAAAREWTASTPPAACNTDPIKTAVSQLSSDALALANQVMANASDADLKKAITAIHETFEKVEKQCGGHGAMKH